MELELIHIPKNLRSISNGKQTDYITKRLKQVLAGEGLIMHNELTKLVSTWRHRPLFQYKTKMIGDEYSVTITVDDEIFYYLDQGTEIRYATMTNDFVAKTTPGSLRSGRGAGGLYKVDIEDPKPGITARNFLGTLREKREDKFNRNMERMFNRAADEWWDSMVG